MKTRSIIRKYAPRTENGFLGAGHLARRVVQGNFTQTDPFILLMDDMLDKKDHEPVGGPHPHAGFETVSLMIDGEFKEKLESMKKGDFQVMTAGSGIVHTETIEEPISGRLFQMWLNLPEKDRWTTPRLQILEAVNVPVIKKDGVNIRLYSGQLENVTSPIKHYTPLIVAEIKLGEDKTYNVELPANYNAFVYVINGGAKIGNDVLNAGDVGWLDVSNAEDKSELMITANEQNVHVVLYAGLPTHDEIVSHGPFIAGSEEEIKNLYRQFRHGEMSHIADASTEQKFVYA